YINLYTSQIINNLSPDYNYDIRYYDNSPIDINNLTESPITKLEFSGDTKTIYLWVKPGQCDPVLTPITFNKNTLSQFDISVSAKTFEVCDDELKGKKEVVISSPDFINQLIPAGYDGSLNFYKTIAGAKSKDSNQFLGNNPTITLDAKQPLQTYYVRFHQLGACDNVAPISFEFKQPKESTVLKDTLICRGTYTDLDAGAGFTSYHWSNGENTQSIKNVPAGDYWVDLGFNNCVYRQHVKVSESAELVIDNILIKDRKVTVFASGGIAPYTYLLDGKAASTNNVFDNVAIGKHTIKVQDTCGFVIGDFSIVNVANLITPNGDGYNDYIDYTDLMGKQDPKFEVYDRNGVLIFKGAAGNQYRWDGKLNGRDLPTSSYWYILEWNESGNPVRVRKSGWILLKNRN
ncbi:MAG: T9SS type B sorting domain-containing protein, partial [Weeksellaceae bacterium]|nr:T9SS type B sorting domain-containing protein [Weeksellaceae bacterium]